NILRFGGSWASEGNIGVGRYFKGSPTLDVNLGPDSNVIGHEYFIAIGYDGSTKFLTTNFYDSDGTLLKTVSQDIRLFDNLGVAPGDPLIQTEMDQLALTHLGWSDYPSGVAIDRTRTWSVDTLAYFDDATGAFSLVPTPPSQWKLDGDGNWSDPN